MNASLPLGGNGQTVGQAYIALRASQQQLATDIFGIKKLLVN